MKSFTNIFKALSDQTRLRIMRLLQQAGTALCVCEIMDSLSENQYNISRHLKVLQHADLIEENKEGRWIFYRLTVHTERFHELLLQALAAIPEALFERDDKRLRKRVSFRVGGKCVIGMNSDDWHKVLTQLDQEN